MTTRSDPPNPSSPFEIVGRVHAATAARMLETRQWMLYAVVVDELDDEVVTLIRHRRHPHVMLVEEPEAPLMDLPEERREDPEDTPGPWPDA